MALKSNPNPKDEWVDEPATGEWQDETPASAPQENSIASDAWQNVKDFAKGQGRFVMSALNPGEDGLAAKLGTGINKSIRGGTVGKDLYNAAEAAVTPLVNDVGGIVAPIVAKGIKAGGKEALENIARRPADYAMDALTFIPGVGELAMGKAGEALASAGKLAGKGSNIAAERIVGSLIKPKDASYLFGKNPERAIIKEGIVSPSMGKLAEDVAAKKAEVGKLYDPIFADPKNINKRITLTNFDTAGFFKQARAELAKHPETNAPFIEKLDKTARDLLSVRDAEGNVTGVRNFKNMTPEEVNNFKREVQSMASYASEDTSQARKALTITNKALRQTANRVDRVLRTHVPEVHAVNERYADLVGAEKAVNHRVKTLKKTNMAQLSDLGVGGALGAAAGVHGGSLEGLAGAAVGVAASKVASSTPFKTALAQGMGKGGEAAGAAISGAGEAAQAAAPAAQQIAAGAQVGRAQQSFQESLDADKAAMDWVQKNPDDPRASKIKEVLKRKHNVQF
jgi:hypothetical protein